MAQRLIGDAGPDQGIEGPQRTRQPVIETAHVRTKLANAAHAQDDIGGTTW